MNDIRLQNFRAFKDTGTVEIKPITILVGSNSSGKSSFLRFLPLLKQSIEESKHGPLLWYKENGVDFGNFKTTVHKGENEIKWSYSMSPRYHGYLMRRIREITFFVEITISRESPRSEYDYISHIDIKFLDVHIDISIARKSFKSAVFVNEEEMDPLQFYSRSGQSILPACFSNYEPEYEEYRNIVDVFNEDKKNRFNSYEDFFGISYNSYKDKLQKYSFNGEIISESFNKMMYACIPDMIHCLDANLRMELNNLTYIGPFRDSPQRYYRSQNLSSHNIDMRGSNSAVFLSEMQKGDLRELNEELKKQYGFTLDIEKKFGQISLYINKGGRKTNIIDNGFGYSQILPVVLAMFAFGKSKYSNSPFRFPSILCIEQPELHLHPLMQYEYGKSLADVLASTPFERQPKFDNKIIIETHSRSVIEAIGEAVGNGRVNPEAVAVYKFTPQDGYTTVEKAEFDNDGYLQNWPIGFLD